MMGMHQLLSQRADIFQALSVNDGPDPTQTRFPKGGAVPCRVSNLSATELATLGEAEVIYVNIYFAGGTNIVHTDICVIGTYAYEVMDCAPSSGIGADHIKIRAKRING
jgi:hypothetical protein